MTDTTTRIVADAAEALNVLDNRIAQMRHQKAELNGAIAKMLADRKPLARIVRAAEGRSRSNGDES